MLVATILSIFWIQLLANCSVLREPESPTKCSGRPYYNVSLTAYYPDFNSGVESDYLDYRGKKLRTLQNFLDGRCDHVTVAADEDLNLNYGTSLCIPELNEHFGRSVPLQVKDHGANLKGLGLSRLDICVRSEEDSYDEVVNQLVTVYAQSKKDQRTIHPPRAPMGY